jgi:hypothetical protein
MELGYTGDDCELRSSWERRPRRAGGLRPSSDGALPQRTGLPCESVSPYGNVDLDELVDSGHRAMVLYNKMIGRVERWLDQIDDGSVTTADIFKAYHLLAPTLDSLVTLQAKIAEQRVTEARGVTPQREAQPKIRETLERPPHV